MFVLIFSNTEHKAELTNWHLDITSTLSWGRASTTCTNWSPPDDKSWPPTARPWRRGELDGSCVSPHSSSSPPRPESFISRYLRWGSLVRAAFSSSPSTFSLFSIRVRTLRSGCEMEDSTCLPPSDRSVSLISNCIRLWSLSNTSHSLHDNSLFFFLPFITLTIYNLSQCVHVDINVNRSLQASPTLTLFIPTPLTCWYLSLASSSLHLLCVSITLPASSLFFFLIPSSLSDVNSTVRSSSHTTWL